MFKGMGNAIQISGNTMFYIGALLTLSGIGAEVGIPLMLVGGETSTVGTVISDTGKFIDDELTVGDAAKDIGQSIFGKYFETSDENLNIVINMINGAL
jgi:hypothetical protein